ncbi:MULTISPECIES: Crp/Fnr family transcriptional regulator [Marinomonas]|uniref:Crp/Fnr family transcriptional regulator n=1 Tax=Marinomonas arctica TaxID=383750 RepID=A0A7H1J7M7_9GAMM|nr:MULTISPECIES: Crp/Fnr family transcriptional regulator [Marinomonas]MCS7487557.1 cyclic nucleotide-binding protein [Marinomonas sp. BSi20414]QNT06493.1 Crp/Fnr family transcriptional regulator [Marinomonas arctica]GGN35564.1 cAMP-binding protein [Marinomonas arctica]
MDRTQLKNSFEAYFNEWGYEIDWQRLTVPMDVHVIRKGDYLFQQGDFANRLYFLHSGLVRYVSVSDEGKEFTQTFAKSPRIIGSTKAMVTGSTVLFGIQALEDCMVSSYPWQAFYAQMRQDIGFLECYAKFLERIFMTKEERENAFVKYSAERRYLDFCMTYPELKNTIPQQQIASYIGITPVALSRIRQKLKLGRR